MLWLDVTENLLLCPSAILWDWVVIFWLVWNSVCSLISLFSSGPEEHVHLMATNTYWNTKSKEVPTDTSFIHRQIMMWLQTEVQRQPQHVRPLIMHTLFITVPVCYCDIRYRKGTRGRIIAWCVCVILSVFNGVCPWGAVSVRTSKRPLRDNIISPLFVFLCVSLWFLVCLASGSLPKFFLTEPTWRLFL